MLPGVNQPVPTTTPSGTATGTASPTGSATGPSEVPKATGTATTAKSALPGAFAKSATTPTPTPSTPAKTATATATPTTTATGGAAAKPKDGSDLAWVTEELAATFQAIHCSKPGVLDGIVDDPAKPLVTCSDTGDEKYILGAR